MASGNSYAILGSIRACCPSYQTDTKDYEMKIIRKTATILAGVFMLAGANLSFGADNQPNERYVAKSGEIFDTKTNLTWQRCSAGQHWGESVATCVGNVKLYNFDEAQKLSHDAWRLPTKDELATLIDPAREGKQKPVVDTAAFPNMDVQKLAYWSNTPTNDNSPYPWAIFFDFGDLYGHYIVPSDPLSVRLVKSGQ